MFLGNVGRFRCYFSASFSSKTPVKCPSAVFKTHLSRREPSGQAPGKGSRSGGWRHAMFLRANHDFPNSSLSGNALDIAICTRRTEMLIRAPIRNSRSRSVWGRALASRVPASDRRIHSTRTMAKVASMKRSALASNRLVEQRFENRSVLCSFTRFSASPRAQ